MRFFLYIKDARKTILSNKMRSGLSTLGIIIGMASVIIMMGIGEGFKDATMKSVGELMKNKITIHPGGGNARRDDESGKPGAYVKRINFSPEIITYIEQNFPTLSGKITYNINGGSEVNILSKKGYVSYSAVPFNWFTLNEKDALEQGSLMTQKHYEKLNFVAVVNHKFADQYFKKRSPLGYKLKLERREFTIIGVLQQGSDEGERSEAMAYIPSTTFLERVKKGEKISSLEVYLDPEDDNKLWQDRLTYLLLKKFNLSHAEDAGFTVWSFAEYSKQIKKISGGISTFLLVIGLISLLVGGIGVMNIMIVSVTERTREIGIRKAIGALNKDIIAQFLVESVLITFIGGVFALGLSYGVSFFINKAAASSQEMQQFKAIISFQVVIVAFVLTALTGIIFGILPARKAAKLKPIDALRFE